MLGYEQKSLGSELGGLQMLPLSSQYICVYDGHHAVIISVDAEISPDFQAYCFSISAR